ncbi:23213_t:CDS:1, partial [Dentiscutata erythropus]
MKFSGILLLAVLSVVNALPHPEYPIAESYPIAKRSEGNSKDSINPPVPLAKRS